MKTSITISIGKILIQSLGIMLLMFSISCENTVNSAENKDTTKGSTPMDLNWFKDQPAAVALPYLLEPCEASTNYQKNNWPGENSCVWAMQKELIDDLPEYVLLKNNELSFQTDNAGWRNIGNTKENQYMLNAYLTTYHLFILKHFNANDCNEYSIFDPKNNKLYHFTGDFYLNPSKESFAIVPHLGCKAQNLILGKFSKSSGILTKEVQLSKPVISLSWHKSQLAISTKKGDKVESIQLLDLP